jgi:hypothetical protein
MYIKPNCLITFGYRIPDLFLTFIFRIKKLKTIQIQHATYFKENLAKKIYVKKNKFFLYLILYIFLIYKTQNICHIRNYFKKGISFSVSSIESTHSDIVYLIGENWKLFFIDKLNYDNKETKFFVFGYHELDDFNNLINENFSNSVCYIAQTAVEDGKVKVKEFLNFIQLLEIIFSDNDYRLFIKLHPRSNIDLYTKLLNFKNVSIVNKFPKCKIYLGHNSSLLIKSLLVTKNVILWKFRGLEIPSYFSMARTVNNETDLKNYLNSNLPVKQTMTVNKEIQNWFFYQKTGALKYISDLILNEINL